MAFLAGFAATVTFHQGTVAVLRAAGIWPKRAFAMAPTKPFGIPAVISLALWGGAWGVGLWLLLRDQPDPRYWVFAAAFGMIAPSLVALLVVFPLKKMPLAGGGDLKVIVPVLLMNGSWGLGFALLMRLALLLAGSLDNQLDAGLAGVVSPA